jgi:uncharacterized protein
MSSGPDTLQLRLERRISGLPGVVVAFSGGVDSSLVAALARRALGERAVAVTAISPALASGELELASAVAATVGIEHHMIETQELARAGYRDNGPDRCFHCKSELYERLLGFAEERGLGAVVSGTNRDDLSDWRPGLRAAAERGVRHPLAEEGVGKAEVRELARGLGILSADKPASPCLSSRIPYGTPVDVQALAQIDRAESAVRALGYREFRVRHFGRIARVELALDELERVVAAPARRQLEVAVRDAGYSSVRVSRRPFRSGSLNQLISQPAR